MHIYLYVCICGGFHSHGGTQKWMVYFTENPNLKWMMTGSSPTLGNHHIVLPCLTKFFV